MIINAKFKIGQIVFLMHDNKVQKRSIDRISIIVDSDSTRISYTTIYEIYNTNNGKVQTITNVLSEDQLYESKEELLKSL